MEQMALLGCKITTLTSHATFFYIYNESNTILGVAYRSILNYSCVFPGKHISFYKPWKYVQVNKSHTA